MSGPSGNATAYCGRANGGLYKITAVAIGSGGYYFDSTRSGVTLRLAGGPGWSEYAPDVEVGVTLAQWTR